MEEFVKDHFAISHDPAAYASYIFPSLDGVPVKAKIGQRLGVPFTRTLQPKISIKIGEEELPVNQDGNGVTSISGVVWDAALFLIDFLVTFISNFPEKRLNNVLDVGTGTGICGISAALLGANKVLLTDVCETSSLVSNIGDLREEYKSKVTFVSHSWEDDTLPDSILHPAPDHPTWDILLCSDLIYDEKHHQSLLKFMSCIPFHCAIFSYKKRTEPAEKLFFEQLSLSYSIYVLNPDSIEMTNIPRDSVNSGLYLLFIFHKYNQLRV
jgi:hypothetical protein